MILSSISAAWTSRLFIAWEYISVVVLVFACPNLLASDRTFKPLIINNVADVWRRDFGVSFGKFFF